jgi:HEAT repeat protein
VTVNPSRAETSDEELKLYALDGLMQIDSEKAVPVLRKLLAGDASRRVKERALFVLSQSDSPAARETLMQVVRTGEPIELRCQAIRTLGMSAEEEDFAALKTIARDPKAPEEVRNAVVEAFMISGRGDEMAAIALSDPDPRIRGKAIESLAAMGETAELRALWKKETDPRLRAKLLEAFGIAGDVDALTEAANSSDGSLRRKAIEGLAIAGSPDANRALRQLYGRTSDVDDKNKIIEAFMIQGDAKTLVELFRSEPNRDLKKKILQQLSMMDDPEANRIIFEVLGEKP